MTSYQFMKYHGPLNAQHPSLFLLSVEFIEWNYSHNTQKSLKSGKTMFCRKVKWSFFPPRIKVCQNYIIITQIKPFPFQIILSESLPLTQVILELRGAKLWWGRKNLRKMLTFWQLTLQCCHTISLSSSQIYSESCTYPSSKSLTLCSMSSSMKRLYQMLQKSNMKNHISLTSHHIFADLNVNTMQ